MSHQHSESIAFRSVWLVVLALALGLLAAESAKRIDRTLDLSSRDGGYLFEKADSDSKTGYELGVRRVVASDRNDDLHWVVNGQVAKEEGLVRLRHVSYDNAPIGREVHWSSVYSWWIRLLSFGDAKSIEWSSLWANLCLSVLAMTGLAFVLKRTLGGGAASVLVLGFCAMIPFRDVFKFGMGDHHAAAILAGLSCVCFLLVAIGRALRGERFLSYVVFSSVCGAVGMWVNVVSMLPVLVGVGCSVLGLWWFWRAERDEAGKRAVVGLVRNWGRVGAAVSVLCYVIEYAPNDFGFRLEVNHPLYGLAWWGACEFLALLFEVGRGGAARAWKMGGSLLLVVQLPLIVLIAGDDVFQVADSFLMAVHDRYIMEFQTLLANLRVMTSPLRVFAMLAPFLLLAIGFFELVRLRKDRVAGAVVMVALGPSCILFLATLYQARWWSECAAALILVLVAVWGAAGKEGVGRVLRWAAVGSLLPGLMIFCLGAFAEASPVPREELRVTEKSIAQYLRARAGAGELVVLASPDATTNMIYYGGAKGIGTFYWENNEGLKRAARMFSSPSMEVARERILEAGVTHVLITSWGGFEKEYLELYREFSGEDAGEGKSFLMRLVEDQEIPLWLRPIPFRLTDPQQGVALIYEVVPESSEGKLVSRRFEYMLEMGMGQAAFSMESRLREQVEDVSAWVSLCRLLALRQRKGEFSEELGRLRSLVAADGVELGLGDSIRFSGVLVIGGYREEARAMLRGLLSGLDLEAMRDLNAETIRHLWDLVEALGIETDDADLRIRSFDLLPSRLLLSK